MSNQSTPTPLAWIADILGLRAGRISPADYERQQSAQAATRALVEAALAWSFAAESGGEEMPWEFEARIIEAAQQYRAWAPKADATGDGSTS